MTYLVNRALDSGSLVLERVNEFNFGLNLTVTDDGSGRITIDSDAGNTFETITADAGSTTAGSPSDTLNIVGGTNVSTSLTGDTLTINTTGQPDQNLWETFTADTGSAIAGTPTDTFNILGGNNVTTTITGDTLTISSFAGNAFENIIADTGSTTADATNDSLSILGGTGISTTITGDTLTVINDAPNVAIVTSEDGSSVVADTTTFNFTGDVTVTDAGSGQVDISIGDSGVLAGQLFTIDLNIADDSRNAWLAFEEKVPTNTSPVVMAWQCEMVALTYANNFINSDVDLEFYIAAQGADLSTAGIAYTEVIRGARTYRTTNITGFPTLQPGDKIGVFCRDQGGDSRDVNVALYFRITADNSTTVASNETNNFVV